MIQKNNYAIVCPGLGGTGAVANVALHHATELTPDAQVFLVSDNFPAQGPPNAVPVPVESPAYQRLRRFGHVPREWHFARAARTALKKLAVYGSLDVVICHAHPVAALSAAPIKRRFGIPYALVTHGDIFDRPPGTYDRRLTWFYRKVTPTAYKEAGLIIALSPHMKQLAARWASPSTRIEVLPNGIDPAEIGLYGPLKKQKNGTIPILLYVGRLADEKGVSVLIKALGQIHRNGMVCELRIVGDGPLRPKLELEVREEGLDRVTFLGAQPRSVLGSIYRDADIVCIPSLSDPLPTVALEALAAGRPVVGTDAGGIPFVVEHGKTGMITESGNPTSLANSIVYLLNNTYRRQVMGKLAANSARDRFEWAAIGAKLRSFIYDVAMSRCGNPR